jgi:hypothetical protein
MLDPAIPEQSLDFAITGRGQPPDVPSWDPVATPSTPHFEDLFVNGRSEPAAIKDGATLTQYWFRLDAQKRIDRLPRASFLR